MGYFSQNNGTWLVTKNPYNFDVTFNNDQAINELPANNKCQKSIFLFGFNNCKQFNLDFIKIV